MKIECLSCHSIIECDSSLVDSTIQCPQCNADIVVKPIVKVVKTNEPERIIMTGRPSIIAQIPTLFIGCCLCFFGFIGLCFLDVLFSPFIFLAGLFTLAKPILAHYSVEYTLTNKKISLNKGIVSKNETSVKIADIKAVNVKRSFCDNIIGCGTISIGSAATGNLEIVIPSVPNFNMLKEEIDKLRSE